MAFHSYFLHHYYINPTFPSFQDTKTPSLLLSWVLMNLSSLVISWSSWDSRYWVRLWEACPNSIFGPLGSTSKIPIHQTSGKHVQTSIHRTSGKYVQNFKSIRPLVSMSYTYLLFFIFSKKKKVLHAWTTFKLDPPTKRYVGNLLRDSVHILI